MCLQLLLMFPILAAWPFGTSVTPKPVAPLPASPKTVVLVLFDVSSATGSTDLQERYLRAFAGLTDALKGGEILVGDIISENPLATASMPLDIEFPAHAGGKSQAHATRIARCRQQARDTAAGWTRQRKTTAQTDLMGAMQVADKVFNGERFRSYPVKALVVFSDMVQETPRQNFVTDPLTSESISGMIQTERTAGRLPNLKGVEVWIAGATAASSGGIDPERILRIQDFWLRYFEACGGNLTKERYAATLMNFRIPEAQAEARSGNR